MQILTNVVCNSLCLLVPALNPDNLHPDSIAERIFLKQIIN